nr:signal peptidase I [uncultured Butyrivibrio sp.]
MMKKLSIKSVFSIVSPILWGVAIYLLIFAMFHPFVVSGVSMEPTFHSQDFILTTDNFSEDSLNRGDIVVCSALNRRLIKRVVALPGDSVVIKGGLLYVNDELSDYNYGEIENAGVLENKVNLSEHQYVVLGDNRNHSVDCRDCGPIDFDHINYLVTKHLF